MMAREEDNLPFASDERGTPPATNDPLILDFKGYNAFLKDGKQAGEVVLASVPARNPRSNDWVLSTNGAVVVTDRRLVFYLRGGWFRDAVEFSLGWRDIASIAFTTDGMGYNFYLGVNSAGQTLGYDCSPCLASGWKRSAKRINQYKDIIMGTHDRAKNGAVAAPGETVRDPLLQLDALLRDGLVSREEYQQLRAAILAGV